MATFDDLEASVERLQRDVRALSSRPAEIGPAPTLPPEPRTPGRIWHDGSGNRPRWEACAPLYQEKCEAGAAAVLKECAVQPEDVTAEDGLWLANRISDDRDTSSREIGEEMIRRILARKGAA